MIGYDDPNPICLKRGEAQEVVVILEEANVAPRFVDTGLEEFGTFLMLYQQYRLPVRSLDEVRDRCPIDELIDDVERAMRKTDELAMREAESYWPLLLEQMRARVDLS